MTACQDYFAIEMAVYPQQLKRYTNEQLEEEFEANGRVVIAMSWYFGTLGKLVTLLGHVNEYPTMHYFGNPGHNQSNDTYMILTEYFWRLQCFLGMLLTCPFDLHFGIFMI